MLKTGINHTRIPTLALSVYIHILYKRWTKWRNCLLLNVTIDYRDWLDHWFIFDVVAQPWNFFFFMCQRCLEKICHLAATSTTDSFSPFFRQHLFNVSFTTSNAGELFFGNSTMCKRVCVYVCESIVFYFSLFCKIAIRLFWNGILGIRCILYSSACLPF